MTAKLSCNCVKRVVALDNETIQAEEVYLNAVYGTSGENKDFFEATPNARFELTITNKKAFGYLKPGKNYYITITPES